MLDSLRCPHCLSEQIAEYSVYETKHNGSRKLYQCIECHQVFSETKGTFLEGLKKPFSFIVRVLHARSEGLRIWPKITLLNYSCSLRSFAG